MAVSSSASLGRNAAQRLVGEQTRRSPDKCGCELRSAKLAAGELARRLIDMRSDSYSFGCIEDVATRKSLPNHLELSPHGEGRRKQIVIRQIEQATSGQPWEGRRDVHTTVEVHRAAIRWKPTGGDLEQRRLAGAIAAEQHAELTRDRAKRR